MRRRPHRGPVRRTRRDRAHPGIDATRLSEIIYFDRSTIGDVLDRMEAKGWILRESTPDDRRIKLLELSPAGRDVLQQVEPGIRRVQERLLAPLTEAEAKTLVRLLARMADAGEDVAMTMFRLKRKPRGRRRSGVHRCAAVSPLQKQLLFLCFVVIAIDGFDTAIIGFIAPAVRAEWGCAVTQLGPLFAAGLFGLMLGAFAVGPLADRHGRKTTAGGVDDRVRRRQPGLVAQRWADVVDRGAS